MNDNDDRNYIVYTITLHNPNLIIGRSAVTDRDKDATLCVDTSMSNLQSRRY